MPRFWIRASIRYIAPATLLVLFVWNLYVLFVQKDGHYGYAFWAECVAGWLVSALVFASGFILKLVVHNRKKKGYVEDEIVWEDEEKSTSRQ